MNGIGLSQDTNSLGLSNTVLDRRVELNLGNIVSERVTVKMDVAP